jgi:hypothetical protein
LRGFAALRLAPAFLLRGCDCSWGNEKGDLRFEIAFLQ